MKNSTHASECVGSPFEANRGSLRRLIPIHLIALRANEVRVLIEPAC